MTSAPTATEIRLSLLAKQHDFIVAAVDNDLDYREALSSGALGSGKTLALCLALIARASIPGAREGLFRKTRKSLVASTLKTLLDGDGEMPPVLPPTAYTHNKSESAIRIKGGGEILYAGLDDPGKVKSMNLTGAGIDEVDQLTELDYDTIHGRCRVRVRGLPNRIYSVCNPNTPSHWLCDRFDLSVQSGFGVTVVEREGCRSRTITPSGEVRYTERPDRYALHTRTDENRHLGDGYLDTLSKTPDLYRKRYFEGLWVGSDGLVYDKWNRDRHCVEKPDGRYKQVIVSVDDGYTNPFAVGRWEVDGDDNMHKRREWYERGCVLATKVAMVKQACGSDKATVVVDPSAADLIAELRNNGLYVVPANNAVFDGIVRVQSRIESGRLTVDPSCVNTCREFETYEWKKTKHGEKDEPVKANDHAMDETRYAVMHLDEGGPIGAAAITARDRESNSRTLSMRELREKDPDWGF